MQHELRSLLCWCGLVAALAGAAQACGDSASSSGGAGAGGASASNGGGLPSGASGSSAGHANGASGTAGNADAGAAGNAGAGGTNAGADAGASGSAGAGGSEATRCHISWTGAATGEADCTHLDVCHKNFLSLGVGQQAPPPAPLSSIQLIYSPDHDLTLGAFAATGVDMANCGVQADSNVAYAPEFDSNNLLTGGTSMAGTLTDLQFGTDPNNPCTGTAHGSFDVVLRQTSPQASEKTLSLHAEF